MRGRETKREEREEYNRRERTREPKRGWRDKRKSKVRNIAESRAIEKRREDRRKGGERKELEGRGMERKGVERKGRDRKGEEGIGRDRKG